MEGRNKGLLILLLILSICIILSQNFWAQGPYAQDFFDWLTYENISYVWVYVCWQDSFFGQILPYIAYFPVISGGIAVLGSFLTFSSERAAKIALKIAGILAILAYVLFFLSGLIFAIMGAALPFPNLPGAYFCLIPGIIIIIFSILIEKPDYLKGHAKEMDHTEYYAIGPERGPASTAPSGPLIPCPQCNKMISADQLFCEECGHYL